MSQNRRFAGVTERLARRFDFNLAAVWYHDRPVMVSRNDYRTGLYNGGVSVNVQGCISPQRRYR
jgi:exodeoxyribonuclease V alpha subunit